MTEHLSDPSSAKAHVRKRSLLTLLDLAASEEQINAVVELLPKYKAAGIEPSPLFSEAFARRCQEVHCPLIALDVFGNFSKYNVRLSLDGARWLIHSLYVLYPLEKLMIATALFPVYSLPPISEDLPSATMVATACYKHGSPESIELANKLRPFIQSMLRTQNIAKAKDMDAAKKNRWIAWSLHKLNKTFLKQTGKSYVSPRFIPKGFKIQIKPAVTQPKAAAA
ncbi:hypothetical protein CPC08DRAFT_667411 [Agrocybe pediades]|nr:hypothetical protein CPC08DRAFT_667411 [Agrocybe pediades]